MDIAILRMGHRLERDKRVSTHCALVARALGAQEITFCGDEDPPLLESIRKVSKQWGGRFRVQYAPSFRKVITSYRKKGFSIVHATMYGLPIEKQARVLRKKTRILLVIGAEKVPWDVYELADYNICVTSQPHSEIAALALLLRELNGTHVYRHSFARAKVRIEPRAHGKHVVSGKTSARV